MLPFETLIALPNYSALRTHPDNDGLALFDANGFWLSDDALLAYAAVQHEPHLYLAWNEQFNRAYIGRAYQQGGRWQRWNYYHLRKLSNAVQNLPNAHNAWADAWFIGDILHTEAGLAKQTLSQVRIAFIHIDQLNADNFQEWPPNYPAPPAYGLGHPHQLVRQWLHVVEQSIIHGNPDVDWLNNP